MMETVGGEVRWQEPVAFDFLIGDPAAAPARVPRRIRRRLLESSAASPSSTAEEIEAKLKDAALRRQQFHEWLSSKARPKQRTTPWSSQEEDVGGRIQAKLFAAEQNRLSLLVKAQMRLARLDERRQAVKTCAEMRFEKERKELGTRVETRVQQAEENRMRLLKAHKQRWSATQERIARSLLQRAIRENQYKECVHSAILQKRASAEKKRMGLLRARARVMQARRVANNVCNQRENEQRLQKSRDQRDEYMKQMETVGGELSWPEPVAFDFPIGDPSAKVPRRIRRRLLESSAAAPCPTVEEIEAKLKDAALRRQQFHEWLSNKARPKQRSTPWSLQEEDVGRRIEAKLYAAEQKRLSLLAKAQMRLARLDERRQAVKTCAEMRFEKERKELGTRVESRVQQAEENRMRLLKAHKQRWAETQERTARLLLQRAIRENKYKECVHSAILQKRACAEKKRMGLLRARARVMQARRVAKNVCNQRENEQRRAKEQLENRLQKARGQRDEYMKQSGSPDSSACTNWNKQGEYLSVILALSWRQFVKSRKTTFSLAEAFEALKVNANSVKSMPFDRLALCIESAKTLQILKALLDRLETRFLLSQSSSSSSLENIDHLLKRLAYPNIKVPTSNRGPAQRDPPRDSRSSEAQKLSRYPVRFVLCAYMVLGHPNSVFSGQGEREITLRESAESFVREFELLIKIVLDSPNSYHSLKKSSSHLLSHNRDSKSTRSCNQQTFRSQLASFDTAWRSYIYNFVAWKVKDARSLEEDLVRAACQLELSMMQKCKLNAQRETHDLSLGMRVIQMQVMEDQKLLREKVLHLSGPEGVERMECALSGTRSKFFEGKESADPFAGLPVHVPSLPLASSLTDPQEPVQKKTFTETNETSHAVAVHSPTTTGKPLPTENELLVNEIVHGGVGTTNNDNNSGDAYDIKAKVKVTMEKAFWDGVMESLKQHEPDNGRVVKLVKEVRDELCEMAPQSWKQEILDSFDLDILSQVLESGTQDTDYLGRILEYALVMLQKLSAPANEDEVKKAHKELRNELAGVAQTDGKCNGSFVLATVMGLRFVLEQIQILKKEISKARIQLVEPVIKGSAGLEYLQKAFADRYGHPSSAANLLPLTVRWISSLGTRLEEEWNEHTHCLAALPTNYSLPPVIALRTGGSIPSASKHSSTAVNASDGGEKQECNGEKIDILVRLGLLELASGIEGLTVDTVPETFKHNALRLRAIQGQLQKIIVFSTSMLVLRQFLISEKVAPTPSEMESILTDSFKRLSELLDRVADAGIEEIVDAVAGLSVEAKLQSSKEMIARLLSRSLQSDDAVFTRVSRSIYLAARGIVLGGSGVRGRRLADAALQRVGGSMLLELAVNAAEALIVMAEVSASVHGPWYRSLV